MDFLSLRHLFIFCTVSLFTALNLQSQSEIEISNLAVEKLPVLQICLDQVTKSYDAEKCTQVKLLKLFADSLEYPNEAISNRVEGTCIIQFIVTGEGTIEDILLIKDIGSGCGKEALRLAELINQTLGNWSPAESKGRHISTLYTVPVFFKLE